MEEGRCLGTQISLPLLKERLVCTVDAETCLCNLMMGCDLTNRSDLMIFPVGAGGGIAERGGGGYQSRDPRCHPPVPCGVRTESQPGASLVLQGLRSSTMHNHRYSDK